MCTTATLFHLQADKMRSRFLSKEDVYERERTPQSTFADFKGGPGLLFVNILEKYALSSPKMFDKKEGCNNLSLKVTNPRLGIILFAKWRHGKVAARKAAPGTAAAAAARQTFVLHCCCVRKSGKTQLIAAAEMTPFLGGSSVSSPG